MNISRDKEYLIVPHVVPHYTRLRRNSIPDVDGLHSLRGNSPFFFRVHGVLTSSIPGAIKRFEDRSFGMKRIEIVCTNCGGHLVCLCLDLHESND